MKEEKNTVSENTKNVLHRVAKFGKDTIQGAHKAIEQVRKSKYEPVSVKEFYSGKFKLPNIVQIVDDAVWRETERERCAKGTIGWTHIDKEFEILCLYDEEVCNAGLQFIPYAECNAVYYVDNFDRSKFIRIDCIFGRSHDEKLAELKHIAHMLGAKSCSIEMAESNFERKSRSTKFFAGNDDASLECTENRHGRVVAEFEGSGTPKKPQLKWFAHDDNIKRLIEMRCISRNGIKSEVLELEGSASATLSQKTAISIDAAIKSVGVKAGFSVEKIAKKEHSSKLIYKIIF